MKGFRSLSESFSLEEAFGTGRVDDANGVLRDVVLLTGNKTSLNKTHYTDQALAEARTRYEGAKMFINHPKSGEVNRSIEDFGGVYKDVKLVGNQLKADLHLVEGKRSMVTAIAKMRPAGVGLSIKDKGRGVEKDGVFFVEGFSPKATFSIDMVCEPSVNKDLFEAAQIENQEEEEQMDFKTLTVETLTKERGDLVESIQNAGKAAILKQFEEATANGMKSELTAAKLTALLEANFPKEVSEAVRKMISPDAITIDAAKAVIGGQKELVEALGKSKSTAAGKPVVKNAGTRKDEDVEEGADDVTSDDDFAAAFRR